MTVTALIPIADGSEDIEAVTIIDVLRRAGVDVTVASVHDRREVVAARQTRIVSDALLADCVSREWGLIALPGGMPGAERLRDCDALTGLLRKHNDSQRWLGAICAAPSVVLAHHGLLEGRDATCHPGFREGLPNRSKENERVVVDHHCITSQGPGSALEFALMLVEKLCGSEIRKQVAAPMELPDGV